MHTSMYSSIRVFYDQEANVYTLQHSEYYVCMDVYEINITQQRGSEWYNTHRTYEARMYLHRSNQASYFGKWKCNFVQQIDLNKFIFQVNQQLHIGTFV